MKTLLDIQQDIRNLENDVRKVMEKAKNISADIDNIRNSSQMAIFDFSKIKVLAKQMDFGKHPLSTLKDKHVCSLYLKMLLSIAHLDSDEEVTINRLVFVQYLQIHAHVPSTLEDLYIDSYKLDKDLYSDFSQLLPEKYKEYFIVDALIVANIAGNANSEINEYIASMVTLLDVPTEKITDLTLIATIVLKQNLGGFAYTQLKILQDKTQNYRHYIKEELIQQAINASAILVFKVPDSVWNFKFEAKQEQKVHKGDLLATYESNPVTRIVANTFLDKKECTYKDTYEGIAPVDGKFFRFKKDHTYYGVIGHEKDDKDSIKAWVEEYNDK